MRKQNVSASHWATSILRTVIMFDMCRWAPALYFFHFQPLSSLNMLVLFCSAKYLFRRERHSLAGWTLPSGRLFCPKIYLDEKATSVIPNNFVWEDVKLISRTSIDFLALGLGRPSIATFMRDEQFSGIIWFHESSKFFSRFDQALDAEISGMPKFDLQWTRKIRPASRIMVLLC